MEDKEKLEVLKGYLINMVSILESDKGNLYTNEAYREGLLDAYKGLLSAMFPENNEGKEQ